jgi:hypothetical protein
MRAMVSDYRASGLTAARWCEKNGCSIGRLKYWIARCNKLANASESGGWARLDVVGSRSGSASGVSVRVGVATIDIEAEFDRGVLDEVLQVVLAQGRLEGVATC